MGPNFLASTGNSFESVIVTYIVIFVLIALAVFIILVNHNVILRKDCAVRRFITHPLTYYSLKRIGSAIVSVLVAVAITFCLLRLRNYKAILCKPDNHYTTEINNLRCESLLASMGFDKPIIVQLLQYFYDVLPIPKYVCIKHSYNADNIYVCTQRAWMTINLGVSYVIQKNAQIVDLMAKTIPVSFRWGVISVIVEIALGYPLGVFMAKYKDRLVDRIGKGYIIFVDSVPGLVYYYILLELFVNVMGLPGQYDKTNLSSLIAPVFSSSFAGVAGIAYWVRRYMLEEFNSDYVKFARAKGLSENRILFTHILRNAVVPLSRSLSTAVISCLGGSFFIENLYSINGFGQYMMKAIQRDDFNLVQGILIFSAILSVLSYLIADITMALCDPRISLTASD